MKKNEDRHITKCDYERSKGFWVRLYEKKVGQKRKIVAQKFFAKRKRPWEEATMQARKWRDKTEKELKKQGVTLSRRIPFYNKVQNNNKSGTTGVYFSKNSWNSHDYSSWVATWADPEDGRQAQNFYVKDHGYEGARAKAIAYRKKKEKELLQACA